MTTPENDPTSDALERFSEHVALFCDAHAAHVANPQAEPFSWPDVIVKEAAFLVEHGPVAYLRYLAQLDDADVRRELDRELQRILDDAEA